MTQTDKILTRGSALLGVLVFCFSAHATHTTLGDPPGRPGLAHTWAPALKQAVGTAYSKSSPVWFTVAQGVLTEIYYPTVDEAQVGDFQMLVTDGVSFFSEQKRDTSPVVKFADDGMTVLIHGKDRRGHYEYYQAIVTDPKNPVVRIRTRFIPKKPGLKVYLLYKPAAGNTGNENIGLANSEGLFATTNSPQKRKYISALISDRNFVNTSAGYVGTSDGWQILSKQFKLTDTWNQAGPGNIALTAELPSFKTPHFDFDVAIGFGVSKKIALETAQNSLKTKFEQVRASYENGWESYLDRNQTQLTRSSIPNLLSNDFAWRSAILIKMHEDKLHPGAIVASLSKPAIPDRLRANEDVQGYALVWPRDLYHAAMGLLASGDSLTTLAVLNYLTTVQKQDGSWHQNFYVNGKPYWRSIQMDQVGYPILLAYQIVQKTRYQLTQRHLRMILKAADFLIRQGPATQQERWEEVGGYSPSTLAVEIASLRAGAKLLGDTPQAKLMSETAERWQRQIENATFIKDHYMRISLKGDASIPEMIQIANGGPLVKSWNLLDGGFLELVRLGIREPNDPHILSTLKFYDHPKAGLASDLGPASYRRYNFDAYGPLHRGGYWSLLAGERGLYAVASEDLNRARAQLKVMEMSALPSGVLPEQTVALGNSQNDPKNALNVASPLVWAHSEYIILSRSILEGEVFDTP